MTMDRINIVTTFTGAKAVAQHRVDMTGNVQRILSLKDRFVVHTETPVNANTFLSSLCTRVEPCHN